MNQKIDVAKNVVIPPNGVQRDIGYVCLFVHLSTEITVSTNLVEDVFCRRPFVRVSVRTITQIPFDGVRSYSTEIYLMRVEPLLEKTFSRWLLVSKWPPFLFG